MKNGARRKKSLAAKADRHALYEASVQDAETDVETLTALYRRYKKRDPKSLREDFCGTAALCVEWIMSKKGRTAVGVDLHEPTMRWGIKHHIAPAGVGNEIKLFKANVLDGEGPKTDVAVALNFSYCVFKTRKLLCQYFKTVRRKLKSDGIFVLDVLGGTDAIIEDDTRTEIDGFVYHWEQAKYDPLTSEILCYIHFEFPDGSRLAKAFKYDWRLWTLVELRELLEEAGFSRVRLLWERTDKKGEGTGVFFEPKRGKVDNQPSWWTYVVAER